MRKIFLILSLLLPIMMLVSSASLAQTKLEATIFSYDGKDFVRTEMDNPLPIQNLNMITRPTRPWSKNAPTLGQ